MAPSDIGDEIDDYIELDTGIPTVDGNRITGKVIYVDDFGNIITNISQQQMLTVFNYGDMISTANYKMPFVHTFADKAKGELLMLIGSHGYLEISVNCGSAADRLQLGTGDGIKINRSKRDNNA